jgi:hypothetical protein
MIILKNQDIQCLQAYFVGLSGFEWSVRAYLIFYTHWVRGFFAASAAV